MKMNTSQFSAEMPDKQMVTFVIKSSVKRQLEEGKEYFKQHKYEEAIAKYKAALEEDPNCALIHYNLGLVYYEHKNHASARMNYERAIEIEPNCGLFYEHLARLLFEMGEFDMAIQHFSQAIRFGEVQPVVYGLLGRAYLERKNFGMAAENLQHMLEYESDPPLQASARFYLVKSYMYMRNYFRMRKEAELLINIPGVIQKILYDLGEMFFKHNFISLSKEFFAKMNNVQKELPHLQAYSQKIADKEKYIDEILPTIFDGDEEQVLQSINRLLDISHKKIFRAMASLWRFDSYLVRELIVEYHQRFGFIAEDLFLSGLEDQNRIVREKVAGYFISSELEVPTEKMLKLLHDESPIVRGYAATYFKNYGTDKVLPVLENQLQEEKDELTRIKIKTAMIFINQRKPALAQPKMLKSSTPERHITYKEKVQWKSELVRWAIIIGGSVFVVYLFFLLK